MSGHSDDRLSGRVRTRSTRKHRKMEECSTGFGFESWWRRLVYKISVNDRISELIHFAYKDYRVNPLA
jgi:hypothetical protein